MSLYSARIAGLGTYVPDRVVTNHDLTKIMDTTHEWIVERSGIEERRWVVAGEQCNFDLAVHASRNALADAGKDVGDIDCIIYATLSPDHYFPGSGVFLGRELGIQGVPAYDIRQQCSGFVYGLEMANALVASGQYQNILLVGSETHSPALDKSTRGRTVTVLFGDGAGAAIISRSDDPAHRILGSEMHCDGTDAECLWMPLPTFRKDGFISVEDIEEGRHFPAMEGQKVFKSAVKRMPEVVRSLLAKHELSIDDIDMLIPHQANLRINEMVAKMLGIPPERVHNNIQKYGNTTAATIPLCLKEARDLGRVKPGDLVCCAAFGAGFTWGAVLLRL